MECMLSAWHSFKKQAVNFRRGFVDYNLLVISKFNLGLNEVVSKLIVVSGSLGSIADASAFTSPCACNVPEDGQSFCDSANPNAHTCSPPLVTC